MDNHYINPKLAAIYDIDSPWSIDRDFYLALAGTQPQNILDMGCGTGLLCNAYAERGHAVTGADPSAAMLEVAAKKPHGNVIKWVKSTAQDFKSDEVYDLIIMTGHAFQVLMTDIDVSNTLSAMRKHLKPEGRIVFESRNPKYDWARVWDYDMELITPYGKVHESRRLTTLTEGHMTFDLSYQFPDEQFISKSELRFMPCESIKQHISAAGLRVEKILGDWNGDLFDEHLSQEMIFILRL